MASKPTVENSRFGSAATNNVAPTGTQKNDGFPLNSLAVSSNVNYLGNEAYLWHLYLSDGYLSGAFGLNGTISPSTISGTVNNYAPTSLSTAFAIRQDLSGNVTLNGLTGGTDGRLLLLVNIDAGGFYIDLVHEATGSTAANRFALPGGIDRRLYGEGSSALLRYDGTSSRWRVLWVTTTAGDHGQETIQISPMSGINGSVTDPAWSYNISIGAMNSANGSGGTAQFLVPINLLLGSVIEEVDATVRGNAGGVLTMRVLNSNVGGLEPSLGSDSTTAAATDQALTVTGINAEVELGENYFLEFTSNTNDLAYRIYQIQVRFRRPGPTGP